MTDLTRDKLIEAMAWMAFSRLWGNHPDYFGPAFDHNRDEFIEVMSDVLDAIGKVAAVVPREANEEMLMAAQGAPTAFEAYPAMVAVADLTRPALSEGSQAHD